LDFALEILGRESIPPFLFAVCKDLFRKLVGRLSKLVKRSSKLIEGLSKLEGRSSKLEERSSKLVGRSSKLEERPPPK
jgi:hypothetical protein